VILITVSSTYLQDPSSVFAQFPLFCCLCLLRNLKKGVGVPSTRSGVISVACCVKDGCVALVGQRFVRVSVTIQTAHNTANNDAQQRGIIISGDRAFHRLAVSLLLLLYCPTHRRGSWFTSIHDFNNTTYFLLLQYKRRPIPTTYTLHPSIRLLPIARLERVETYSQVVTV